MRTVFGVLAILVFCGTAVAQVYSYKDRSGKLVLTDTPGSGRKLVKGTGRKNRSDNDQNNGAVTPIVARNAGIEQLIQQYAAEFSLEEQLLRAVIKTESDFDHKAVSHKGAMGLMQLMPATAARYGVDDRGDAVQNIRGGTAYLSELLKMFDSDLKLALAAYNAGENAVIRYGNNIPPYRETQNYVQKVLRF